MDIKGAKTIMINTSGNEKTRYTVVLACCADGTKLPPLLIFKRKLCLKMYFHMGFTFMFILKAGWMDGEGMKLWLE